MLVEKAPSVHVVVVGLVTRFTWLIDTVAPVSHFHSAVDVAESIFFFFYGRCTVGGSAIVSIVTAVATSVLAGLPR